MALVVAGGGWWVARGNIDGNGTGGLSGGFGGGGVNGDGVGGVGGEGACPHIPLYESLGFS